jgi:hypothetical protein
MLTARDLEKTTRPLHAGAADGKKDYPPSDSAPYASETEQKIESLCREEMANELDAFADRMENFRDQIAHIRKSIPSNIMNKSKTLKARLASLLLEHSAGMRQAADELEKRNKDLRQFKVINEITYEPDYSDSKIELFGTGALIIAIESAANAYFFGQASEAGLAGGFFYAIMISLVNVVFGFIAGALFLRQINHVQKWRMVIAMPPLIAMIVAAIVFNVIVGHYREALLKNPDEIMLDVVPNAMRNFLDLKSLESIILVMFGFCIFCLALYRGYKIWDRYPGYMSKHRARRDAEEQLQDECESASKRVDDQMGDELDDFDNTGSLLRAARSDLDTIVTNVDSDVTGLASRIDQLEQAGNTVIKIYRSANIQVRSAARPPPRYFRDEFRLNRAADLPGQNETRDEFAAALKEVASAEAAFQAAQLELATERATLTMRLQDTIANAEADAKERAKADSEAERAADGMRGGIRQTT